VAQVQALIPDAIAGWQAAGLNEIGVRLLQQVQIEVAGLGGNILGQEDSGTIQINATAAGYNWYVNAGSPAADQVDLLTVLEHELGHVLGLPDNGQVGDLMDISLGLGVRRAPAAADVALVAQTMGAPGSSSLAEAVMDAVFAEYGRSTTSGGALAPSASSTGNHIAGANGSSLPLEITGALPGDTGSTPIPGAADKSADDLLEEVVGDVLRLPAIEDRFSR
jgi:hypothetical protein